MTCETRGCETPARRATSSIVTRGMCYRNIRCGSRARCLPNRRWADALEAVHLPPRTRMWLLAIAALGFLVPNGFFIYWLLVEFSGLRAVLQDRLALGFILDVFLALILLAVYFAKRPIGPVRWYWFVVLSLLGGLGFSLPLYYWLNQRRLESGA